MNVKSTVPLCLLAGMVALTSGCTAMKLSSEDPTTRMEAVRNDTGYDDFAYIACMKYPDDVRLEAFNKLVANKDQASIDAVAKALCSGRALQQGVEGKTLTPSIQFLYGWEGGATIKTSSKELQTAIYKNISKEALTEILGRAWEYRYPYLRNDEILLGFLSESPHALALLQPRQYFRVERLQYLKDFFPLLKGDFLKEVVAKAPGILEDSECNEELLFKWYEETKDEKVFKRLLSRFGGFGTISGSDALCDKILKQYPDKFLEVCVSVRIARFGGFDGSPLVSKEKRQELLKTLAKDYPESEVALDCLFAGLFDAEDRSRVVTEANAQKIFERLQKREASRSEVEKFATIDLLNACPEFAQKVDPKAAASLLSVEHVCEAGRYSTLPPRIAQAFIEETGGAHHVNAYDSSIESPCEMSDAILRRLSVPDAYAMLKKKVDSGKIRPSAFRKHMQTVISACGLNDTTVDVLLKDDFAPSAMGYRLLQAALKVDTVSEASKAKIQAYMEKVRAEALANEAKAKEERLVIDHCYVPMREIDHLALPPQKSLQYGEKDGTITRFVWTVKQCYDWFELENDEFQWKFAQKFGLADFKFDMDVRVEEAQTSFSPGLAMLDIMGGDGTPVMPEPPKISVNHWWLSTTRARGKNVEFLYNDEDKNNTLIMREIQ